IPGKAEFSQCTSSPARQARQSPHVTKGCRITRSPTSTLLTAEPISTTVPAFSCPSTYGSRTPLLSAHCPSTMCSSVRHTPAAFTSTSTSKGPSTPGSETSSIVGGLWYSCTRTARIMPPRDGPDTCSQGNTWAHADQEASPTPTAATEPLPRLRPQPLSHGFAAPPLTCIT